MSDKVVQLKDEDRDHMLIDKIRKAETFLLIVVDPSEVSGVHYQIGEGLSYERIWQLIGQLDSLKQQLLTMD